MASSVDWWKLVSYGATLPAQFLIEIVNFEILELLLIMYVKWFKFWVLIVFWGWQQGMVLLNR